MRLTDEQRMLRDVARDFAREWLAPHAAERDRKLGASQVREAMLKVFQVIGTRSDLADQYRDRLARVLY